MLRYDERWARAWQAYLGGPEHARDRAFWAAWGQEHPPLALDPSGPLRLSPQEPVLDAPALRARAQALGCSPNAALLWAFGQATSARLGLDRFPIGVSVDLRAHFGDLPTPCAVHFVPVAFDRALSPRALQRRSFQAVAHARLPTRTLRQLTDQPGIQPAVMFDAYMDHPQQAPPAPLAPPPLRVERLYPAMAPVHRPHSLAGQAYLIDEQIVFRGRAREGVETLLPAMREALARL